MSYTVDSYTINYDGGLSSNVMLRKFDDGVEPVTPSDAEFFGMLPYNSNNGCVSMIPVANIMPGDIHIPFIYDENRPLYPFINWGNGLVGITSISEGASKIGAGYVIEDDTDRDLYSACWRNESGSVSGTTSGRIFTVRNGDVSNIQSSTHTSPTTLGPFPAECGLHIIALMSNDSSHSASGDNLTLSSSGSCSIWITSSPAQISVSAHIALVVSL